jgi:hypothetical protein
LIVGPRSAARKNGQPQVAVGPPPSAARRARVRARVVLHAAAARVSFDETHLYLQCDAVSAVVVVVVVVTAVVP